jgi:hypothetical protein
MGHGTPFANVLFRLTKSRVQHDRLRAEDDDRAYANP